MEADGAVAHLPPLAARVVGVDEVPRALVPLLLVNTLGTIAFSSFFAYIVVWATDRLEASGSALGVAFLASALASAAVGAAGGALSDRVGRRPVILVGWGFTALGALAAALVGTDTRLGLLAMVATGALGAVGQGADMALVADLVREEAREGAYAAVRLCANLGAAVGPLVGAVALGLGGWSVFFGVAIASAFGAFAAAWRWLPARGRYTPEPRGQRSSAWVVVRDVPFAAFWVAGLLAFMIYTAYEVLLPRFLLSDHDYAPWTWGALVAINPVLVVIFQMRVTAWAGRRGAPGPQLALATLIMGLPFLLLVASASPPVVVLVIVLFVMGEMLWVPTGQALAERLSPDELRGAYMGAFGATGAVAFALGPFVGLTVHDAAGSSVMWAAVAGFAVVGALTLLVVIARVRDRLAASPVVAQPPP